jgi:hypothetical protein
MDQLQQEDLVSMPREKQMEAMGLAPQPETTIGSQGQQEDLVSMPPEKQMEAMGVAPQPEVSASFVDAEVEAYEAERAKREGSPSPPGGRRSRRGS